MALFAVLLFSWCCSPAGPAAFRSPFLPLTPAPAHATNSAAKPADPHPSDTDAPVPAPPSLATPVLTARLIPFPAEFPPRPSRLEVRLGRAEQRFEEGRRLYQAGDTEGARKVFDEALDLVFSNQGEMDQALRIQVDSRFQRLVDAIHRFDLEGLGAAEATQPAGFEPSPIDELLTLTFPIDPKLKDRVREQLRATRSQLPLEQTDAVLSFINFFSSPRGRPTLIAGLRRAGRYRAMISRILDEEGLPPELIFLAQAESGFFPRAVSHMSAVGLWQFILMRGREYGLNQTPYTDERMDPEKATRAAARHLRDLFRQFGDWYLAIAAYNCGPHTVERAVQRTGYADIWELRNRGVLPRETSNYVPIIIAMTIMAKNAKDYGIADVVPDAPIEYDTVKVDRDVHLPLIADLVGSPLAVIRELNPSVLRDIVPQGYDLRIPRNTTSVLQSRLAAVPVQHRTSWRAHVLGSGETLSAVSARFGVTPQAVRLANASRGDIEAGDLVLIPSPRAMGTARAAAPRWTTRSYSGRVRRAAPATSLSLKAPSKSRTYPSARLNHGKR